MRSLSDHEIQDLLASDIPARLSTLDADGYPHVTPIWFIWADNRFLVASDSGRPHVRRIEANPKVGLVIDVEDDERADGERPNRQVRAIGDANLSVDTDGSWSVQIWAKYRRAQPSAAEMAGRLAGRHRILITIRPHKMIAVASV